jgi:hypothetical protein
LKYFIYLFFIASSLLHAQSIEPRLYSNAPIGTNFLILSYAFSSGTLPNSPEIQLVEPHVEIHSAVSAYAHFFNLLGKSAKVDVMVPTVCMDGNAIYEGSRLSRNVCGIGDIKTRFAWNLYGAPALSKEGFKQYHQDIIIGASLQLTIPTGRYDAQRLVNVGANRWALKPGIGISKAIKNFIVELAADVEIYEDNDEFLGTIHREQDPIYSTQIHGIYNFKSGIWLGLDANYYWGGETTANGIEKEDEIVESRYGTTLAFPINQRSSLKLYGHTGVYTRTGTDFDMLGLMWQYRF